MYTPATIANSQRMSTIVNILVVCKCIQRNLSIFFFMSKCFFFSNLYIKGKHRSVFSLRNNSLWAVPVSLTNLQVSNILMQSIFQRNEYWFINLVLSKTKEGNSAAISFLSILYDSILQSVFVISSFAWFMKLIIIYLKSSPHVIPYLKWQKLEFFILYLTFISLRVAIYTFPMT